MTIFDQHGNMRGWAINPEAEESNSDIVELIACGDTGSVRNLENVVLEKGPDYVLNDMRGELSSADIVLANLEAPYSTRGQPMDKIPAFRLHPRTFSLITEGGINVVSLANNHIFDYGHDAFEDTINLLKANKLEYFGAGWSEAEAVRPALVQTNGMQLAFLGFMDKDQVAFQQKHSSGIVPRVEFKKIRDAVEKIRDRVDWLIVSLHFGLEYTQYPSPRDISLCRKLIDCGVDIIVGHHPHYPQGVEKYRSGLIAYSLGNFVWDQNFAGHTASSYILKIRLSKNRITQVKAVPFRMNAHYQLEKCCESDALNKIEFLSSVVLDSQKYPMKWYFVSRNYFLNTIKDLCKIPFSDNKRRQFHIWARTISSSRALYTLGCFLLFFVSFRAFFYELRKR